MDQYNCYAILLTDEEAKKPKNYGYNYVKEHIAEAVEIPCEIGDRIYDKACTLLVHDDKVYEPYRDFIILKDQTRYYLCKPSTMTFDHPVVISN